MVTGVHTEDPEVTACSTISVRGVRHCVSMSMCMVKDPDPLYAPCLCDLEAPRRRVCVCVGMDERLCRHAPSPCAPCEAGPACMYPDSLHGVRLCVHRACA